MTIRPTIAMLSLCLLAASGAMAETYEGVHPLTTERARSEVQAEAIVAAHSPNPYATGATAGEPAARTWLAERATVAREAVAAAHAPNQNLDASAFYESEVPVQFARRVIDTRLAGDVPPAQGE